MLYYSFRPQCFDFTGAFLQTPVPPDKKIYVRLPPGYVQYEQRPNGTKVELVGELGKYQYGLQEASKEFADFYSNWLIKDDGWTQSWVDSNCYYKMDGGKPCLLFVYVDDNCCVFPTKASYESFVTRLHEAGFVFETQGDMTYFLGMNVSYPAPHEIKLSHSTYIVNWRN